MKTNKMFKYLLGSSSALFLVGLLFFLATPFPPAPWTQGAAAQTSVTQTTLSAAVSLPTPGSPQNLVTVASATGIVVGYELFTDHEAMLITSISGTTLTVQRGYDTTTPAAHPSGAIVYISAASGVTGSAFVNVDPPSPGACTLSSEVFGLRINVTNGDIWQCTNSVWLNMIDAVEFVPATACNAQIVGASPTNYNGYTTVSTSPGFPVLQINSGGYVSTTNSALHYYTCQIPPPSRLLATKGAYLVDVVFLYGVQTNALTTQSVTLASGQLNGKTVFQNNTYPTPAASETATGLAELARADSGTMVMTPVAASFNVSTTTAGEFFSVKLAPATPIPILTTDLVGTSFNVPLAPSPSGSITNTPGYILHFRGIQGY